MIDLHCHVLPGIDDGAADLDDSVAMARIAAADGIEAICATPHIRSDHDVVIDELPGRVERLNAALASRGIGCRILPGGEVAEPAVRSLDDRELLRVSLGSAGGWILLEPAAGPLGDPLHDAVDELAGRGYRSLIAHPERHLGADLGERLAELAGAGALIQATAAALLSPVSAEGMLELAERGLLHVLASDAHSSRHGRPPVLTPALARLRDVERLRGHIDWIARTAPAAIAAGEPVEVPWQIDR